MGHSGKSCVVQRGPLASLRAAILLVALAALSGCSPTTHRPQAADGLIPVDLLLNWFPEAEHGGYYAALAHGFYEQQGLRVRILPGGPGVPVLAQVASGRVAFGVSNADTVLLGWSQQARTVAVFAPLQISPRCIMVHEESGIRRLEDLRDITLAMNPSSTFSLFLQNKLPLPGVKVVPYSGNVAPFVLDQNLAQQAYTFSEPYVAQQRGSKPRCLLVSDLGFNPYTSLLVTGQTTLRANPDLVRRMVTASVRGWQQYLADPAAAHRRIGGQNDEMSRELLDFGAEQLRPLCVTADVPRERIGQMTPARWQTLLDQLTAVGAIAPGAVQSQTAWTVEFLPNAGTTEPAAAEGSARFGR
jgi:NitT/TauT family transport system substrate-binding protein